MYERRKWQKNRQNNQFKTLIFPWDLSEGAEQLLELIKKYQHTYNVTTQQYANLMMIPRRNLVFYLNELISKGRIKIYPESRKRGRGHANKYEILEFNAIDWCQKNGLKYEDITSQEDTE